MQENKQTENQIKIGKIGKITAVVRQNITMHAGCLSYAPFRWQIRHLPYPTPATRKIVFSSVLELLLMA